MPAPKQKIIKINAQSLQQIKSMLEKARISAPVIANTLTVLKCVDQNNVNHNQILTVIDYSLPSSEKRLWVFDLLNYKWLFYTYVTHGINSGSVYSQYFSNKFSSKASSLGIFESQNPYYGRDGLSLKLSGLEKGFNDNAYNRFIVMHGAWYVEQDFITKYGRPGRSWGCPAVPLTLVSAIINTIKNNSLMVTYYPTDDWLRQSKFLHCGVSPPAQLAVTNKINPVLTHNKESRQAVIYADKSNKNHRTEADPVIVILADSYQRIFNAKPPLTRMLRRQINNTEYIALTNTEFDTMIAGNNIALSELNFVVPYLIMKHGYYETQFKTLNLGKIKDIAADTPSALNNGKDYTVHFENNTTIKLHSTTQFIRWLGL